MGWLHGWFGDVKRILRIDTVHKCLLIEQYIFVRICMNGVLPGMPSENHPLQQPWHRLSDTVSIWYHIGSFYVQGFGVCMCVCVCGEGEGGGFSYIKILTRILTHQWPPRQGSDSSRPSSWGRTPWTRHCWPWRSGTCRVGWARHCKCPSALSPPEKSTFWILQLFQAEISAIKIQNPEIFQNLPSSGIFHQTSPFPCTP